ncbi:radical SAM protein [Magnetofaba australis]|nr:radical SAM/SPASM domain-containing protein [Magnetofaba australis]
MPVPENLEIKQLDLELNGSCNLKCEMCPQAHGREREFLSKLPTEVFEKIVTDALQYGVQSVSLHGSGEPTLNRDMPERIRFIKEKGLKCVSFTNGVKLDEQLAREIIDAGLDVLRISAVGHDREAYQKWMSKDCYLEVRDNIKRFVELNKEMGGRTEVHMYHLASDYANRDAEAAAYQQNWVAYTGAYAEIWLMHNWSGDQDIPYARQQITGATQRRTCGRPFSPLLQVRAGGLDGHHGAVVACCMVLGKDSQGVLGHLDDQSIAEVVGGDAYNALRAAHREGRFDDIPYCANCDQLYDLPESLVWTNIPGRKYGESKVAAGVDHRTYGEKPA